MPEPYGRLRGAVMPVPKAGQFYARSWLTYLTRRPRDEIPVVRPTLALGGQALYDEVLIAALRMLRQRSDAEGFLRIATEAEAAVAFAKTAGWLDDPASYFELPPVLK